MTSVPMISAADPLIDERPRRVRGRARRVLHVITGVILGLVALAAVGIAVAVVVLKIGFSPVLSPSMEPAFAPGDLILTQAMPAANVQVGDVVVLPRPDIPGERYAHRVAAVRIDKGQPVVRTKGDANQEADAKEMRITSELVPTVIGDVPRVGEIAIVGGRTPVRIGLIVLIGVAVLVAAKRALWRRPG